MADGAFVDNTPTVAIVGTKVGCPDGEVDGLPIGCTDGSELGCDVGCTGVCVCGLAVGRVVKGDVVGNGVGTSDITLNDSDDCKSATSSYATTCLRTGQDTEYIEM